MAASKSKHPPLAARMPAKAAAHQEEADWIERAECLVLVAWNAQRIEITLESKASSPKPFIAVDAPFVTFVSIKSPLFPVKFPADFSLEPSSLPSSLPLFPFLKIVSIRVHS